MSFSFGGHLCLDAADLKRACDDLGLPTAEFWGRANSFSNVLGGMPGRGWILLTRKALDDLEVGGTTDTFQELIISDAERETAYPKVLFTGEAVCITPGGEGDPAAAYCVEIADKRWLHWERGEPLFQAFNCRWDADGEYVTATLNSGTAYTWAQLLAAIWPAELGTQPTLPFTPDGTPETFWYQGETKLQAVQHLLTRLCCALHYNQETDVFTIVRLGVVAAATAKTLARLDHLRLHDLEPQTTQTIQLPEKVRVQHRVKQGYTDGTLPYYTHDVTVDPAAGDLGDNTYVLLLDDLIALYNGTSITNTALLEARRDERAADFIRFAQYFCRGEWLIYSGHHAFMSVIGAEWNQVVWKEVGTSDALGDGILTEISSGQVNDRRLQDWWRHETADTILGVCPIGS